MSLSTQNSKAPKTSNFLEKHLIFFKNTQLCLQKIPKMVFGIFQNTLLFSVYSHCIIRIRLYLIHQAVIKDLLQINYKCSKKSLQPYWLVWYSWVHILLSSKTTAAFRFVCLWHCLDLLSRSFCNKSAGLHRYLFQEQ